MNYSPPPSGNFDEATGFDAPTVLNDPNISDTAGCTDLDLTDDMLPSPVLDFTRNAALRLGAPMVFVAVALLSALAALVGNSIRLLPKQRDDWSIVPVLWAMLIGSPSTKKSPALFAGVAPLQHLERRLAAEHQEVENGFAALAQLNRLRSAELTRLARDAVRAGQADLALAYLSDMQALRVPVLPRLIVGDTTETRLVELLAAHPSGLLKVQDELPRLLNRLMTTGGSEERALYLSLFNGTEPYTRDRSGREPLRIETATLSVCGTIQPAKVTKLVEDAVGEGADGLLPRFQLAVWPDETARSPRDIDPDYAAVEAVNAVFSDLYAFTRGAGGPQYFRFSPQAQEIYNHWAATFAGSGDHPAVLQSYVAKLGRTICILALLFELIEGGRQSVSVSALTRATRWAPFLRSHALKIMRSAKSSKHPSVLILEKRDLLPETFTLRDIHRQCWTGLNRDSAEAGLSKLVNDGTLAKEIVRTGGRPSVIYYWRTP